MHPNLTAKQPEEFQADITCCLPQGSIYTTIITIISNINKEKGKKSKKTNHIEFTHLIKWLNSLEIPVESPSVATKIAMGRRRSKKKSNLKKMFWSRHHSLFWKTMEKTIKKRHGPRKPKIKRFGSRLRVGKVLAPYNRLP